MLGVKMLRTRTKAMPVSVGRQFISSMTASMPPAEAPMATIVVSFWRSARICLSEFERSCAVLLRPGLGLMKYLQFSALDLLRPARKMTVSCECKKVY